jgi:hypothetical protein
MNRVAPQDLPQFLRRYRLPGGRLRGVRVLHSSKNGTTVEFRLSVREAIKDLGTEPRPVRLTLRLAGVDEFRFQMRPSQPKVKIVDARLAHLNGLFYVTFDAILLDSGERPQVHDFRASEVYAAGRDLFWEEPVPGESQP